MHKTDLITLYEFFAFYDRPLMVVEPENRPHFKHNGLLVGSFFRVRQGHGSEKEKIIKIYALTLKFVYLTI